MQRKSIAITAVVAVIIVICLLFACWYMQHDDEEGVEIGVGYTQVFEETRYDSDGNVLGTIIISQTMVGLDGDVMTYQMVTSDGDEEIVRVSYAAVTSGDDLTLYLEGATLESRVYGTVEGDWYVSTYDDMTVYSFYSGEWCCFQYFVQEDGSYAASELVYYAFNEIPDNPTTVDTVIEVGDHMTYHLDRSDGTSEIYTMTVTAVDGDLVTYYDPMTGTTATCTAAEFLGGGATEGSGTYIVNTGYGLMVCSLAVITDGDWTRYLYLGQDDGVCYLMYCENADGSWYGGDLAGSSNVSSETYDANLELVGQIGTYEVAVYDNDTGDLLDVYTLTQTKVGILGRTVYYQSEYDGETYYFEVYLSPFDNLSPLNLYEQGVTVDSPLYGEVVCDVYRWYSDCVECYGYIDGDGNDVLYVYVYPEVTAWFYVLDSHYAELDACGVDTVLEAGDYMEYAMTDDSGDEFTMTIVVDSVDGGYATYTNSNSGTSFTCTIEQLISGGEIRAVQGDGACLLDTPYGLRLCSVKTVIDDTGTQYLFVGLEDGVCYYTVYIGDDRSFSGYLTSSSFIGSGEAPTYQYESGELGDYEDVIYISTDADGLTFQTHGSLRMSFIDDEGFVINYIIPGLSDGAYPVDEVRPQTLFDLFASSGLARESAETDIPYLGTMLCDVYVGYLEGFGSARFLVDTDTGLVVMAEFEYETGGSVAMIITSTSVTEGPMEYGSATVGDVEAGDVLVFAMYDEDYNGIGVVVMTVLSVDGDTVTYENGLTGETVTCTAEEFLAFGIAAGTEPDAGSIFDSYYGQTIYDVYYEEDGDVYFDVYVGSEDGLCYWVVGYDADWNVTWQLELVYASMASGTRGIAGERDVQVGDYQICVTVTTSADGSVEYDISEHLAFSLEDGVLSVWNYDYVTATGSVSTGSFIIVPEGTSQGTEVLNTPFGLFECEVIVQEEDGTKVTYWVYDGVVVRKLVENADGSSQLTVVSYSTLCADPISVYTVMHNTGEIAVGDWITIIGFEDGEYMDPQTMIIIAVDGDMATYYYVGYEDDLRQDTVFMILNGFEEGAAEWVGQCLYNTCWGTVVCDIYEVYDEYLGTDVIFYLGAEDGIQYAMEYNLDGHEYMMLMYSSSTVY